MFARPIKRLALCLEPTNRWRCRRWQTANRGDTLATRPGGETGRHKGLKIPRRRLHAGSSPAPGTSAPRSGQAAALALLLPALPVRSHALLFRPSTLPRHPASCPGTPRVRAILKSGFRFPRRAAMGELARAFGFPEVSSGLARGVLGRFSADWRIWAGPGRGGAPGEGLQRRGGVRTTSRRASPCRAAQWRFAWGRWLKRPLSRTMEMAALVRQARLRGRRLRLARHRSSS